MRYISCPYLLTWADAEPSRHSPAHHWSNQFIEEGEQKVSIYSLISQFTTQPWAFSLLTVQKTHSEIGKIMLRFSCL